MNHSLQFFCPHWGNETIPFDRFLEKVKLAGYDGIEMSLPLDAFLREEMIANIHAHGLLLIAQHWETIDQDFETHLRNFTMRLNNLASVQPLFINSQTGKDYFSFEQNEKLIAAAESIMLQTGVNIVHETHRGKFSFAAHITKAFLDKIPSLQLCLDISHWCCVAETLLEDQLEAVAKAITRTHHIHARVGYTQAPQIMDPRAPEWKEVVELHMAWWQKVVNNLQSKGKTTTITTEFGPFPYLQHLPYTHQPIYNQWDVNTYMMHLLKERLQ